MPPVPPNTAPPVFPGRDTALPQPSRQEPPTPPRGTPRGWFDEFTDQPAAPENGEENQDFGPTGQPTEIPYRYKR
ncbi:hypothetical protein [Amycolatopsis sp. NPDC051371]|uniref:hypothetical protein n=1 Tax=Amycolatopsis sp. NPDC051371 TaxID=3155800 RepID=UPI003413559B